MTLVAGIDSSTQSCKVVVRDVGTGALVRHGSAPHPAGTEADPADWEQALHRAVAAAGGIDDVAALSVGGQQHGAVIGTQIKRQVDTNLFENQALNQRRCRGLAGRQWHAVDRQASGSFQRVRADIRGQITRS